MSGRNGFDRGGMQEDAGYSVRRRVRSTEQAQPARCERSAIGGLPGKEAIGGYLSVIFRKSAAYDHDLPAERSRKHMRVCLGASQYVDESVGRNLFEAATRRQ